MQKNILLSLTEELLKKHRSICWALGQAIFGSCLTDSTHRRDMANVANIPKNIMLNVNTDHDMYMPHPCIEQESK